MESFQICSGGDLYNCHFLALAQIQQYKVQSVAASHTSLCRGKSPFSK